MTKSFCLAIGLLATILGLTIAVDTAFADGCCCCCCGSDTCFDTHWNFCGMVPCFTPGANQNICSGAKDSKSCTSGAFLFVQVNSFPEGNCLDNIDPNGNRTFCNTTLEDCYRDTTCVWDSRTNPDAPVCQNGTGGKLWKPANKKHTDDCIAK